MLDSSQLLERFRKARAFLDGHFQLSSGLHSPSYFQCALLFEDPRLGRTIGEALAGRLRDTAGLYPIDRVIGPAMGGILVAYEVAAALGVKSAFAERDSASRMVMRRGFQVAPGERVVVCEDVITTGGSALEVTKVVREQGAQPIALACIVDRSERGGAGKAPCFPERMGTDVPLISILSVAVLTWTAEACPLCASGEPVTKPGSRPPS